MVIICGERFLILSHVTLPIDSEKPHVVILFFITLSTCPSCGLSLN